MNSAQQESEQKIQNKMRFIMKALNEGWTVKKRQDQFLFVKKHENKREVLEESYLENFVMKMSSS